MTLADIRHKVPLTTLVATMFCQIQWMLHGDRFVLTHVVVALGALTMVADAVIRFGRHMALRCVVAVIGIAWLIEFTGINSGFPFGRYHYATNIAYSVCNPGFLCPATQTHDVLQLFGVPVIVPVAWLMMTYPAALVGQLLGRRGWSRWCWATVALATWDLFLDPQFLLDRRLSARVSSTNAYAEAGVGGWWVWHNPEPHLPGIPHIPLTNYAGWFIAAAAIQALLLRILRTAGPTSVKVSPVPMVFYLWTWVGGIIANLYYLQRPAVALWGGTLMGVVAVPLMLHMIQEQQSRSAALQRTSETPVVTSGTDA